LNLGAGEIPPQVRPHFETSNGPWIWAQARFRPKKKAFSHKRLLKNQPPPLRAPPTLYGPGSHDQRDTLATSGRLLVYRFACSPAGHGPSLAHDALEPTLLPLIGVMHGAAVGVWDGEPSPSHEPNDTRISWVRLLCDEQQQVAKSQPLFTPCQVKSAMCDSHPKRMKKSGSGGPTGVITQSIKRSPESTQTT
jgi:hypothetical protein